MSSDSEFAITDIDATLERFLSDSDEKVLCLHGPWGSGKSHYLKHFTDEYNKNNNPQTRHVFTISMLGITSKAELEKIYYDELCKKIDIKTRMIKFSIKNLANIIKFARKFIPQMPDATDDMVDKLARRIVDAAEKSYIDELQKNSIIIIDDYDRKSTNIKDEEVIGFIYHIKTNNHVVIVMEDNESIESSFRKHAEKIIDLSVIFDPSPSRSLSIAAKSTNLDNDHVKELLENYCNNSKLKNIRIIKKIIKTTKYIYSLMPSLHDTDNMNVIHREILLSAITLSHKIISEHIPHSESLKLYPGTPILSKFTPNPSLETQYNFLSKEYISSQTHKRILEKIILIIYVGTINNDDGKELSKDIQLSIDELIRHTKEINNNEKLKILKENIYRLLHDIIYALNQPIENIAFQIKTDATENMDYLDLLDMVRIINTLSEVQFLNETREIINEFIEKINSDNTYKSKIINQYTNGTLKIDNKEIRDSIENADLESNSERELNAEIMIDIIATRKSQNPLHSQRRFSKNKISNYFNELSGADISWIIRVMTETHNDTSTMLDNARDLAILIKEKINEESNEKRKITNKFTAFHKLFDVNEAAKNT